MIPKELPPDLAKEFRIAAVFGYVVHFCLALKSHTAKDLEKQGADPDEAYRLGVRSIPGLVHNLIIARDCLMKFGPEMLKETGIFYYFVRRHRPGDCDGECQCDTPSWLIDIDFMPSGLIIPRRNRVGWITRLQVFRNITDPKPFILHVRNAGEIAA
jgi:hypothetical protein